MKRFSLILALMFVMASTLSAQQVVKKRIGVYTENGNTVVAEANTMLVVDITMSYEEFVAGPYARYAQKYMGARASQVGYMEYSIVDAEVALAVDDFYGVDNDCDAAERCFASSVSFPDVLPDKLSTGTMSVENAAEEAAETIFDLRRVRMELICGDLGEGVYGAGLESALNELDRLEKSYMELFYGKREQRLITRRFYLPVDATRKSQVLARFNAEEGILGADNLNGDIIMVTIQPSEMHYPESNPKGKISYRYANNATVIVTLGQQLLNSRVLPIYEFGKTINF